MSSHSDDAPRSGPSMLMTSGSRTVESGASMRRSRARPWTRSWGRWAMVMAVMWVMTGCEVFTPDPPLEVEKLDLVAQAPISAAYVEFLLPAGSGLVSMHPLRSGLLLEWAVTSDRVRVAWVGDSAVAGAQIRVTLASSMDAISSPDVVEASAFASSAGGDLGAGILGWRATAADVVLDAPLVPSVDHGSVGVTLLPAFADHPLGDLDRDGELGVRDALVLLDLLRSGGWSDYSRYHADLDGDDRSDASDVTRLLEKLVDPLLPAGLHVKPRALSFVELDHENDRDAIVLVANQGRSELVWRVDDANGTVVEPIGGIFGQSAAMRVTLPESARRGWQPGFLLLSGGGDEVEVRLGHLVVLIAGQSNASGRGEYLSDWPHGSDPAVRLFGNDYRWRTASEPHDRPADNPYEQEEDDVSRDATPRYSFATRLGELLVGATGFTTYLVPAAKGASSVSSWLPRADLTDRTSLFGSAAFRGLVSAGLEAHPLPGQVGEGGPVSAIVWYQGEADSGAAVLRQNYLSRTRQVMAGFDSLMGANVVFVQLATHCLAQNHVQQHALAELQRLMETGSGDVAARPDRHMVVAFDLPRSDCIHLSAFGQRLLAERIDLAIREHVLGADVDGTGPRLAALEHVGGSLVVTLRTTHEITTGTLDASLVTVFDGPPSGSVDDDFPNYGANEIGVLGMVRDPNDPRAVRITLASPPQQTPHVRYMGRVGQLPSGSNTQPSHPEVWENVAGDTIRSAASGLPLPTFGPLPAAIR